MRTFKVLMAYVVIFSLVFTSFTVPSIAAGGDTPVNLAIGLNPIGSDGYSNTIPAKAFDGDINTYWQAKNSPWASTYVGVDAGQGKSITFNKVRIVENAISSTYRLKGFKIQVSDNLVDWVDIPNASGTTIGAVPKELTFAKYSARAVRFAVTSTTGLAVGIGEFEVYFDPNAPGAQESATPITLEPLNFPTPTVPRVVLNGKQVTFAVNPQTINGTVFVPMAEIYNELGVTMNWDEAAHTITGSRGEKSFRIQVGSNNAIINGRETTIEAAPIMVDSSVLIPLSFISESLGAAINWREEENAAHITVTPSSLNTLIDENFETMTNERLALEWVVPLNRRTVRSALAKDGTNTVVKMEDIDSSIYTAFMKGFTEVSGNVTLEYKVKQEKGTDFTTYITSGEKHFVQLLMEDSTKTIKNIANGSAICSYETGKWYKLKIDIDTNAGTFDITVYNENGNEVGKSTGNPSFDKIDTVAALVFFTGRQSTGSILIDDVKVTAVDAVDRTDNTFLLPAKLNGPDSYRFMLKTKTLETLPDFESYIKETPFSKYGGDMTKRVNATGFFRTEKIDGRWWMVDPDGYLYIDRSANQVQYDPNDPAAVNISQGDPQKWMDWSADFLRDNGFTGLGCWSSTDLNLNSPSKMPYTFKLNALSQGYADAKIKQYPNVNLRVSEVPPIFDKGFEDFLDTYYAQLAAYKDDPYLIGYYTDNEIGVANSSAINTLDKYLTLNPNEPAFKEGYDAAWNWLKTRKGNDVTLSQVTDTDREAFRGYFFEKYYEVTTKYIRKYDPNHLTLGSRLHGYGKSSPDVLRGAGKYLDVISMNMYNTWDAITDSFAQWEEYSGKPILVSEFYAKADESTLDNTTGAGWGVKTQADRGLYYQTFFINAMASKACVGAQWFYYKDSNSKQQNSGVLDQNYNPYTAALNRMKPLNENIYNLIEYLDEDPAPPVITVTGVEDNGAYNRDITPVVSLDKGTYAMTLNGSWYFGKPVTAEGSYKLVVTAVNRYGNKSEKTISFTIDKTAPQFHMNGINNGDTVKLNQKIAVTWAFSDEGSGIKTASGDIMSGTELDTSKVGANTLTFTASDNAGNETVRTITYYVNYDYSGTLSPVNREGSSQFKVKSTVPVKFQLKDSNGEFVDNAKAQLYLANVTDGNVGAEFKADSTSTSTGVNYFRYDSEENQYVFNLSTKDLKAGVYRLRIDLGDGTTNITTINLK